MQVLPFILCRTKAVVAADIPAKTIIDVFCPLSDAQRQLYTEFLSNSRWTDATLEAEFRALAGETVSDVEVVTKALSARKVHPFQALHYLKLLCIHPSLVIESQHSGYRQRLVDELASSTKMLHLADLLVKSGIVSRDEASESFDQLLTILQASLMGEKISGSAQNSAFSRHSDDEDDDEEEEGSKSEDDSRDGNVGDKNAQQSAQENDNSTKQLNRSQATTRSTVKDAVHKACKDSKPRSKPILKAKLTSEKVIEKSSTSCELIFAHKCLIFSTHKAVLDIVQTVRNYLKIYIFPFNV